MKLSSHYSATLRLGLPIAIAQLGTIILALPTPLWWGIIAHLRSRQHRLSIACFNLATMIILGYSYGLTPFVSAKYSQGDKAGVGAIMRRGLMMNLFLGRSALCLWCPVFPSSLSQTARGVAPTHAVVLHYALGVAVVCGPLHSSAPIHRRYHLYQFSDVAHLGRKCDQYRAELSAHLWHRSISRMGALWRGLRYNGEPHIGGSSFVGNYLLG